MILHTIHIFVMFLYGAGSNRVEERERGEHTTLSNSRSKVVGR